MIDQLTPREVWGDRFVDDPIRLILPLDPGRRTLEISLDLGANVVLQARAQIEVVGRTGLRLVLLRSCAEVECGDGVSPNCLNGTCVPAGCLTGAEDACGGFDGCQADTDCPATTVGCLAARCLSAGACVEVEAPDVCASEEYCAPTGCLPTPVPDAGTPMDAGLDAGPTSTLVVEPAFPAFPNLGDYLARPTRTTPIEALQAPAACTPDTLDFHERCLNGGELRRVRLSSESRCEGLTLVDSANVFEWFCDDTDGVEFLSWGLRPSTKLADLVAGVEWRPLGVELRRDGVLVAQSALTTWWTNPIVPLSDSPGTMRDLGRVAGEPAPLYFASTDIRSGGYRLTSPGIMLAIAPGARVLLEWPATAECPFSAVATDASDGHCAVVASGQDFVWIEGHFEVEGSAPSGSHGIALGDLAYARVRHVAMINVSGFGLALERFDSGLVQDVDQARANRGFELTSARFNRIRRLRLAQNGSENSVSRLGAGDRTPSFHNILTDLVVTSSGSRAGLVFDCGSSNHITTRGIFANNRNNGLWSVCNARNTHTHISAINNGGSGVHIDQNSRTRLTQVLSVNNARDGLLINFGASDNRIAQLASLGNGESGVQLDARSTVFSGVLMVGENGLGACQVDGRSAPGLLDGSCSVDGAEGSADYTPESSSALLRVMRDAGGVIAGRVLEDDQESPVDTMGAGDPASEWWSVSSRFRFWGQDGGEFPADDNRGRCTTGACRIWDARPAPTSAVFERSADGAAPNAAFTPGSPCPPQANGDIVLTDLIDRELLGDGLGDEDGLCDTGEECEGASTFLVNAWEIIEDHVGDDDGLCESNERCRYSPHIGAWQGDTPDEQLVDTCVFDDAGGPVTGVTLYGVAE